MKVSLESTERGTIVINTPACVEVWRGRTESGIEVVAYISVMAASNDTDKDKLRAELAGRR